MNKRQIRIGEDKGDMIERAGTGYVSESGEIDCCAEIGEDTYAAIEAQLEDGQTEGCVTTEAGRVYVWDADAREQA